MEYKLLINHATNPNGKVPDMFGCCLCKKLVFDPTICAKCGNAIYCKGCIVENCQCGVKLEVVSLFPILKNMLKNIKVICN